MVGLWFGSAKRNGNFRLEDPHPIPDYGTSDEHSGKPFQDGYTLLSRANPDRQGSPPNVTGTIGPCYQHGGDSFEQ